MDTNSIIGEYFIKSANKLKREASKLFNDQEIAEEALMMLMSNILEFPETFINAKHKDAYVCRSLYNRQLNMLHMKKQNIKHAREHFRRYEFLEVDDENAYYYKIERQEKLNLAFKTINSLPESQCKKVIKLYYEDGYSRTQIAETMGLSINTVKTHLKLGLRHIRKRIMYKCA